jgi:hypothetical protein
VEFQELCFNLRSDDDSLTPETPYAFRDYINYMGAGMRMYGGDIYAIRNLPDVLKEAGFEEVQERTHKCPIGLWPQDKRLRLCGLFLRTAIMDGIRGFSRRPLTALGWTELQIEMFLVDVRKALMNSDIHTYFTFHLVHGRKPLQ